MTIPSYWLYVAGINFSSTLFDTQDLSTIRGSSYGLLSMPSRLARWMEDNGITAECIFTGASEGLFKISDGLAADGLKKKIAPWLSIEREAGEEPFKYLSFGLSSLSVGKNRPFHEVFSILKSKIRLDQLRNVTVNLAAEKFVSDKYCQVDRLRPATRIENGTKARQISDSVFYRQEFGKDVKQSFYKRQFAEEMLLQDRAVALERSKEEGKRSSKYNSLKLELAKKEERLVLLCKKGKKGKALEGLKDSIKNLKRGIEHAKLHKDGTASLKIEKKKNEGILTLETKVNFSNSFSDIVQCPPEGVADNLQNKMAVLYMDGNQFTKKMGIKGAEKPDIFRENSLKLKLYQVRLLRRLVEYFLDAPGLSYQKDDQTILRLETLFWGGDEMMLVMPSWAALDVCRIMFEELQSWSLTDHEGRDDKLTYAAGLVIAHHKTPIIQLKNLAVTLANDAKELDKDQDGKRANRNILQYEILESDDIPDAGNFKNYRERKYKRAFCGNAFTDLSFTLNGDKMIGILKVVYNFKTKGVARSRLYNIINEALNTTGKHHHIVSDKDIRDKLAHYKKDGLDFWDLLVTSGLGQEKDDGKMQEQEALMALIHMLQLWDYVDPLGTQAKSDEKEKIAAEGKK